MSNGIQILYFDGFAKLLPWTCLITVFKSITFKLGDWLMSSLSSYEASLRTWGALGKPSLLWITPGHLPLSRTFTTVAIDTQTPAST